MLTFYYAPWSRASSVLWLLEEIGQPYDIELVDIRASGGVPEEYRKIQPNKKVPAVVHDGTVITERAAISIYLADRFPQAGLAPAPDSAERAAYLTWLVYSDSVYDPVVAAKAHGHDFMGAGFSYGSFDEMVANLEKTLQSRPYIAGDTFTAADVQIASGIRYGLDTLHLLPERPVFRAYLERVSTRPAFGRASETDYGYARQMGMTGE